MTEVNWIHQVVGSGPDTILWWQMVCRGVIIFIYTLLLVRFGGRRIFGKNTSFDIVVGVILGSIMSRALTANAQLFPTLAAATTLVILHRLLAVAAMHNHWIGHLIKGTEVRLVKDGKLDVENLRRSEMTEHDLGEALRLQGKTEDVSNVKAAYLERSGDVSVVSR